MANIVTFIRVILAIVALIIVKMTPFTNLIACVLVVFSMLMDALDGFIARRFCSSTLQGSVYDILADRIIENTFFVYFATMGLFNVWPAIIIVIRGLIIDGIRTLFLSEGKTAFGAATFHKSKLSRFLACSRISRGTYNMLKTITFSLFTLLLQPHDKLFGFFAKDSVVHVAHLCLWLTVALAIVRALPVIYDWKLINPHRALSA